MAVLPPDPLFRFKSDLGHLHTLCFLELEQHGQNEQDERAEKSTKLCENKEDVSGAGKLSPARQFLLAAGESGIVYFFDLESNRLKYKQVMGISIQAVHAYLRYIIIQEKEGLISVYQCSESHTESFPSDNLPYSKIAVLPCASGFCKTFHMQNHLFLAQENGTVLMHDFTSNSSVKTFKLEGCTSATPQTLGQLMCLEVAPTDNFLFAGFETGDVFIWNILNGTLISHGNFNECIISITYDAISRRGVVGGVGEVLQVFGVDKTTFKIKHLCELALTNDGCQVVKVRKDRKILVCGGFDGRTRIYSWKTLRLLAALVENHASVTDVQFSPWAVPQWGSQVMAVAGADGIITIWNLYK